MSKNIDDMPLDNKADSGDDKESELTNQFWTYYFKPA